MVTSKIWLQITITNIIMKYCEKYWREILWKNWNTVRKTKIWQTRSEQMSIADTHLMQGCHKPSICKNTVFVKCIKTRYACIVFFESELESAMSAANSMATTINSLKKHNWCARNREKAEHMKCTVQTTKGRKRIENKSETRTRVPNRKQ